MRPLQELPTGWESDFDAVCLRAEIEGIQKLCVELAAEGYPEAYIATKQRLTKREVRCLLGQARAKLAAVVPEFEQAARQFGWDLIHCCENRSTYDERPEGVRGVTPAQASKRFQGGRIISGDDMRLRQDDHGTIRLWAQSARAMVGAA